MSLGPLYVLLGKVSVQVLCPFFNWVVCFQEWSHVSSLYILESKPVSEVSLANMSSHTVGSLFILILFSLAVQKLFILMRSHLFILSFKIKREPTVWENIFANDTSDKGLNSKMYRELPGRQATQSKNRQRT